MTNLKFNIVSNEGVQESVTAFVGGKPLVATREHPQFANIVAALQNARIESLDIPEDELAGMFDLSSILASKFIRLSERVMVRNGRVFFDGVPTDNALSAAIVRFHSEGNDNFVPLVCFMEKLYTNPNPHSIEHLYRWMAQHRFGLTPDGDMIAFKGVGKQDDIYLSSTSGTAIVNGEIVKGKIPNMPGTIIEMPRDEVRFDPRQGCSAGLHAGNWRYARGFGSVVLQVKINPRDVVSVPTDSSDEKIRCCRYRVVNEIQSEPRDMFYATVDKSPRVDVPALVKARDASAPVRPSAGRNPAPPTDAAPAQAVPPTAAQPRPGKRAKSKPAPKPLVFPDFYEQFQRKHWDACPFKELQQVWKSVFEMKPLTPPVDRKKLTLALMREAKNRLATWPENER